MTTDSRLTPGGSRRAAHPAALLLILLLAGVGCASYSPVEVLVRDGSFTAAGMAEGGVAVGGVVSSREAWPIDDRIRYGEAARNALTRVRPGVRFLGTEWFVERTGDGKFTRLTDNVASERGLGPVDLEDLRAGLEGVRYIVFGRVEKDEILRTETEEPDNGDGEKKTFRTKRTVQTYMEIYDLMSRSRAWAGRMRDTEEDENSYYHRHSEHPVKETLRSAAEVVVFGEHPDPKPLESMLDAAFVKFNEALDSASGPGKRP